MSSKKYYNKLDIIRVISCIAVLLYHLNILKGGYLAVCIFFVLSGYLSCISAFRKEKFSIIEYYKSRFLHIYLPLLIVTFISIFVVCMIFNISWISLKPETTSILLGYNNFWQLSANLDYFARHVDSPFMHFWYIGILLQFDLVFPFIFIILRKIGDKLNKIIPCIITFVLSILGIIYFIKTASSNNIMAAYYNTFSRVFSIFIGLFLGFIHSYYKILIPKFTDNKVLRNLIFYFYLLISIVLFVFVDATSKYFVISMIGISLITCRMIDYSVIFETKKMSVLSKINKYLANISYEVYLIQYPVIFLLQYTLISKGMNILFVILITLVLSVILHLGTNFKSNKKVLKYTVFSVLIILSSIGLYKYIITKDHTEEMKKLEETLNQNEKEMQSKQEEYALKLKQEEENWKAELDNLESGADKLKDMVKKLSVIGVGDSVMLGAVSGLYKTFPNGYFDAKVSRTDYEANDILLGLKNRKMLGNPIVINLGTNGDCKNNCKDQIIKTAENRKVFWVTVVNDKDVHVNSKYYDLSKKYSNVYVIDWSTKSKGHKEYFAADGIHLTGSGIKAYSATIYEAIYNVYLDEYNAKKEQAIKAHEEQQKTKISFYGNDILLNSYKYLKDSFTDAKFNTNKEYTFDTLKQQLETDITNNSLSYNVVLAFDNTSKLTKKDYKELVDICKDRQIYILSINKESLQFEDKNVIVLDFYNEMKDNLMADSIHLTDTGNQKLSDLLTEKLLNEK